MYFIILNKNYNLKIKMRGDARDCTGSEAWCAKWR